MIVWRSELDRKLGSIDKRIDVCIKGHRDELQSAIDLMAISSTRIDDLRDQVADLNGKMQLMSLLIDQLQGDCKKLKFDVSQQNLLTISNGLEKTIEACMKPFEDKPRVANNPIYTETTALPGVLRQDFSGVVLRKDDPAVIKSQKPTYTDIEKAEFHKRRQEKREEKKNK